MLLRPLQKNSKFKNTLMIGRRNINRISSSTQLLYHYWLLSVAWRLIRAAPPPRHLLDTSRATDDIFSCSSIAIWASTFSTFFRTANIPFANSWKHMHISWVWLERFLHHVTFNWIRLSPIESRWCSIERPSPGAAVTSTFSNVCRRRQTLSITHVRPFIGIEKWMVWFAVKWTSFNSNKRAGVVIGELSTPPAKMQSAIPDVTKDVVSVREDCRYFNISTIGNSPSVCTTW